MQRTCVRVWNLGRQRGKWARAHARTQHTQHTHLLVDGGDEDEDAPGAQLVRIVGQQRTQPFFHYRAPAPKESKRLCPHVAALTDAVCALERLRHADVAGGKNRSERACRRTDHADGPEHAPFPPLLQRLYESSLPPEEDAAAWERDERGRR